MGCRSRFMSARSSSSPTHTSFLIRAQINQLYRWLKLMPRRWPRRSSDTLITIDRATKKAVMPAPDDHIEAEVRAISKLNLAAA